MTGFPDRGTDVLVKRWLSPWLAIAFASTLLSAPTVRAQDRDRDSLASALTDLCETPPRRSLGQVERLAQDLLGHELQRFKLRLTEGNMEEASATLDRVAAASESVGRYAGRSRYGRCTLRLRELANQIRDEMSSERDRAQAVAERFASLPPTREAYVSFLAEVGSEGIYSTPARTAIKSNDEDVFHAENLLERTPEIGIVGTAKPEVCGELNWRPAGLLPLSPDLVDALRRLREMCGDIEGALAFLANYQGEPLWGWPAIEGVNSAFTVAAGSVGAEWASWARTTVSASLTETLECRPSQEVEVRAESPTPLDTSNGDLVFAVPIGALLETGSPLDRRFDLDTYRRGLLWHSKIVPLVLASSTELIALCPASVLLEATPAVSAALYWPKGDPAPFLLFQVSLDHPLLVSGADDEAGDLRLARWDLDLTLDWLRDFCPDDGWWEVSGSPSATIRIVCSGGDPAQPSLAAEETPTGDRAPGTTAWWDSALGITPAVGSASESLDPGTAPRAVAFLAAASHVERQWGLETELRRVIGPIMSARNSQALSRLELSSPDNSPSSQREPGSGLLRWWDDHDDIVHLGDLSAGLLVSQRLVESWGVNSVRVHVEVPSVAGSSTEFGFTFGVVDLFNDDLVGECASSVWELFEAVRQSRTDQALAAERRFRRLFSKIGAPSDE